ncbi:beta strand repeat-containing protein, partial [Aeromicrobium sp.]|uniref:beta strand repeat-containing protein n=1 Tax=Aeromicrobium sp. TaxID=1871063 RepID=UPI003FA56851
TIRGSGSGRESIWLNTAAAATVDVQTADGSDLVYGGAGTAAISTGKGGDQVSLSSGAATVNSGDDGDVIYLGTGQATVNAGAGNDTVYTHLSNSVYINNVYYGANTTGGWNAGNSLDGGANFDTLYFYGPGTFDLTANSIVNFEQLYLGASSLTLVVNNDLLSTVTSIGSNYASNRLAVTDASVNLSNKSVSNLTITSNNATGTTFTVNSTQTAFQIFGGSGGADVLNAPTLTLTSDQRGIIFATSSIESIVDSTGSYSAPAADPAVFKLTSGSDTVPPVGVTPPDSITVNASTVTLTSGDRLHGGATGTDVLALYGGGIFDLRASGVAELTGFEEVRLVNFTANEAGLILRGTADPVTIRGSGSGRESIWLNTAAAATVDVQTADGGDVVYAGAGTAVVSTGKGGDQVSLSSGAATVNSGDDGDTIRLGTGQATVNTGAGNDTVYTHLSNSVYINNVYYGANTIGGWNAANSLDGGANSDSLQFYGSGTFDLTANSIVNFESLYLGASSLTLIVDNDLLSTVTSIASSVGSNRLAVTDASVDLSNKSVSNLTITSNNAAGTTFTVNSTQTAFQIFGGSGGADVLNAPTLAFTSDQRGIIFATSSIESIIDSTGSYSAPAPDPAVFKLTTGSDTVPPVGVTPPDSITVNA